MNQARCIQVTPSVGSAVADQSDKAVRPDHRLPAPPSRTSRTLASVPTSSAAVVPEAAARGPAVVGAAESRTQNMMQPTLLFERTPAVRFSNKFGEFCSWLPFALTFQEAAPVLGLVVFIDQPAKPEAKSKPPSTVTS